MTVRATTSTIYQQLKSAQERCGVTQVALASQMGIPQPRLSELEGRMRNGNVSKQLELLLATAETLGLVAVLVPQGAVEHVKGAIDDYEIAQRIGRRSQFDEIYDEVAEEEAQPVPGFGI